MRVTIILATLAVALMVFALPQSASAVKPSNGCAPGYDLGAITLEEALLLPNVQAGIADGIFNVAALTAGFDSHDRNNDELVCFELADKRQPSFVAPVLLQRDGQQRVGAERVGRLPQLDPDSLGHYGARAARRAHRLAM